MIEMLYFTAAWCNPCKQMAPFIAELQAEGRKITKIDVDQDRAMADKYGVRAMPTFIILRDGTPVRRIIGAQQKLMLESEMRLAEDS